MIKKKLMKHFKLRNVVKTMVLATAVVCGLTAGTGTVKAEEGTATPTPVPTQTVYISMNNYESDDRDYKKKYEDGTSILFRYNQHGTIEAITKDNLSESSTFSGYSGNTPGLRQYGISFTGYPYNNYGVEYLFNTIDNDGNCETEYFRCNNTVGKIGSYLLCKKEDGNSELKDVSCELTKAVKEDGTWVYNKDRNIHLGLPSDIIYPTYKSAQIGAYGSGTAYIKKTAFSEATDDNGCYYYGWIIEIENTNKLDNQVYDSFVVGMTLTKLGSGITTEGSSIYGTYKIPETITIGEKNYPVIGFNGASCSFNNVKKIIIPKNISFIGDNSFVGDESIEEIKFEAPENITYIGYQAFEKTGIKSVDLTGLLRSEDGCSVLGRNAFAGCKNLTSVTVNGSEKELEQAYIPTRCFKQCTKLKDISWGKIKNLQIGDEALADTAVSKVKTPASMMVQIGKYAFKDCNNINNAEILGN